MTNNIEAYNKTLTADEQKEKNSKAGIKSGESRRARKSLREELTLILETGDNQERIATALIEKAKAGDIKAFETIRDTLGEKPSYIEELQELRLERERNANKLQELALIDKQREEETEKLWHSSNIKDIKRNIALKERLRNTHSEG